MKRVAKLAIGAFLGMAILLAIALALMLKRTGREGSGDLEQWIGGQIVGIANGHLFPQLSFSDLDYEYPGTVRLKNLRLVAADPRAPGATLDILGAAQATVVLAHVPSYGEAIVIESIILEQPLLQVVGVEEGSSDFVGFSNLLKASSVDPTTSADPAPKLSDVFEMKLVELRDARLVYDPRIAGTEPMELDQINTRLDIHPDAKGLYALRTTLTRVPVFAATIAGKLNLDHMSAEEIAMEVTAQLGAEEQSFLPPQLQKLLREHEVRGAVTMKITGSVPVQDLPASRLAANLTLTDGNVAHGDYQVPIQNLTLSAVLAEGRAELPELKLSALGGEAVVRGSFALDKSMDAQVEMTATNLLVQDTLRQAARASPTPQYWGRLNADLSADVPVSGLLAALAESTATEPAAEVAAAPSELPADWGRGRVRMDRARLVRLPVIGALSEAMRKGRPPTPGRRGDGDERAFVEFTMNGDLVRITRMDYVGAMVAARGNGTVSLSGKLNLLVNGGPIEKVQQMLGDDIGKVLGSVTDRLVTYRVGGTTAQPRISAQVGRGMDKVGRNVGNQVQKGVGQIGRGIGGLLDPDRGGRSGNKEESDQKGKGSE